MNPFRNTARVSFELSNLCNYTVYHSKCPTAAARVKEILPTTIVRNVMDELGRAGYQGELCFHNYNEPLIDPRLMLLMLEAGQRCVGAKLFLWTNGFYLTQDIVNDLEALGLKKIYISAYSDVELEFLNKLVFSCEATIARQFGLDDVLKMYDWPEQVCSSPCFAPLGDVIIHSDGRVGLCCLDWKRKTTFGDLKEWRLSDILSTPEVRKVYNELRLGVRSLPLCKRCTRISCGGAFRDL